MASFSFTKQTNLSAMKNIIAIALFICLLIISNFVSAQDEPVPDNTSYKTAIGIRLSSSAAIQGNSISLKHFLNETTAIEGLFSFSDPLTLGALLEFHHPFSTPGLQWMYGAGGYIGTGKE